MQITERNRPAIEKIIAGFDDNDDDQIRKEVERIVAGCRLPVFICPNLRCEFTENLMDFAAGDFDQQTRDSEYIYDHVLNALKYQWAANILARSMEFQEAI